jgi:hypothetical protein
MRGPCLYPLRVGLKFIRWGRVASRVGLAAALGATLVLPSRLDVQAERVGPIAALPLGVCPIPEDEAPGDTFVADMDGGMGSGPFLPKRFPKDWRAEPCPKDPRVRVIADEDGNRRCFIAFGSPPCGVGFEHNGECVMAGGTAKAEPRSIQR